LKTPDSSLLPVSDGLPRQPVYT